MPHGKKLTLFVAMNAFQATPARVSSLKNIWTGCDCEVDCDLWLPIFDRAGQNDSRLAG
jgi:hypothetical protein